MTDAAVKDSVRTISAGEGEAPLMDRITSVADLARLYGTPSERALTKELDHIADPYRRFIEAAPFAVIATVGPEGLDCSPRGDPAGFVRVADPRTLMLPDRRGNNRLDSLTNIVRDPRVSLLFLIPGVGETIRINGSAEIVTDAALCDSFAIEGVPPRSVIVVRVERAYYQCPKALVRSGLWEPESRVDRASLPSAGDIHRAILGPDFDAKAYDRDYPAHQKRTIY